MLVVGASAAAPATIAPSAGPAGTPFAIVAGGFGGGEQVVTWLNTPAGVQAQALAGKADDQGDIQLQLDGARLAPGYYGLVLHGLDTEREYLLPFSITG